MSEYGRCFFFVEFEDDNNFLRDFGLEELIKLRFLIYRVCELICMCGLELIFLGNLLYSDS